ncbi:MAG TPA: late competence development ComFB family protein [Methylomusa anaerophila]|uniref:Late competence development protein ComFB n=2 Tax=Methylomusa anaerophila TaxID=1930071 RepID=A0A348AQG8_9FIRM|nr:late competence development ComFB family protein [Methylomusa anaerophila]BBB93316.1 late competence development protein ComFB [Methylomusa anaerophila]HML86853.1 late competence development ComFB family protein [Methylomusa anaerophila]
MKLKNYMEDLVWQYFDEVASRHKNICTCENCRLDIVALALNFLPPRYIVTSKGETYTKVNALEQQFRIDIITALSHAIQIVSNKPHHEPQ